MRKICNFGISFLDDKIGGIYDEDLLIIGAESGIGKSTIAEIIAFSCIQQKIKPALFSLENFAGNTCDKKAFELFKAKTLQWNLKFRQWIDLKNKTSSAMDECVSVAEKLCYKMNLIERTNKDYTIDLLEQDFKRVVEAGCQVIILDHLDYFDAYSYDNDLQHTKRLMKIIQTLNLEQIKMLLAIDVNYVLPYVVPVYNDEILEEYYNIKIKNYNKKIIN